jgi:HEAT repeat protein
LSILTLFWLVSWSVCGFALANLIILIVYRKWANLRAEVRRREREQYIELLKARAEQPAGTSPGPADDVLTDLTVEILELVRGDAKQEFAERMAGAGTAGRLHARLRRGDARTRILAAAALANFGDEETKAALTEALDDRNPEVRLTAALSLAAEGQAPSPEEVIRRLGIGEGETSLLTVMLLVEMAQTDVGNVRSLLLEATTTPATRAAAAEALARCDDFAAVPIIAALAMDADPWASELPRYLGALAEIEHPAGSTAVLHCLDSPSAEVRAAAARAAGRIGIEPALDRLERLLGDADWWVRFQAAHALLRFGEEGRGRLNSIALRNEEPARETAAITLAEQAGAA